MGDERYFPRDYEHARQRFLKLVGTKDVLSWSIPSKADSQLYVDSVYYPPQKEPRTLVVLVSGIHGLEGYAGHAVQAMFLEELRPRLDLSHTGVLVVHAMNPWGFKYHSRNTENGVNLNRNASLNPALFATHNDESVAWSKKLIPAQPVSSRLSDAIARASELPLDEIVKTVGLGQYQDPRGMEFGGFGPEPQIRALGERLRELMPAYRDVLLLDLHTGLGERKRLHLLGDGDARSVNEEMFAEIFQPQEETELYDYTPADAPGFYPTYGALNGLFPELASTGQRVCALTMEFGTIGHDLEAQLDGLNRWLLEHQGTHYGYADAELEREVKALYLERFRPAAADWQANVVHLAREVLTRVFGKLGAL